MAREKTLKTIDSQIAKAVSELNTTKEKYSTLCKEIHKLRREREKLEAKTIYAAFKKSRKTYKEVLTFLSR